MPACIRLRRISDAKRRYYYRICVADRRKARDSGFIEDIGFYNPTKNPAVVTLKKDRYDYWIKMGAQASDTVKSLAKKINKAVA